MFPRPDPWVEQARREAEITAHRRRRRRRWLVPLVLVLCISAGIAAAFVVRGLSNSLSSSDSADPPKVPVAATIPASPTSTIPADELVAVDEVWLLDRGDGVFDWGLSVVTPSSSQRRSGVVAEVRLLDAAGEQVMWETRILDGVNFDVGSAIAGRLVDPERPPVRIEFDIAVGQPSLDPALAAWFDVRALDREGDELTGRVRATAPFTEVTALFVWRDESGAIAATAPLEIAELRPGIEALFMLDLTDELVAQGRPDDVIWLG